VGIKRGHIDLSLDISEGRSNWFWLWASLGMVLLAALIYQLIVGGIRIGVTGGRLMVDPQGLFYWWQSVTHH
jgi:hypothetical protein